MQQLRILTEASGSFTAAYLIKAIQEAGHISIASDIDERCFGRFIADGFITMPKANASDLWEQIERALIDNKIDLVLPSLDETLLGWAERKEHFASLGIHIMLSDPDSVAMCQDKWLTYQFFASNGIPTPATSLKQEYPLIKPRLGRGGAGVRIAETAVDMEGCISQQLVRGVEFTIDIFCDHDSRPVYIVPRRRIAVRDGKSSAGVVVRNDEITKWVEFICSKLSFVGPINIQCFVAEDDSLQFIEINPRIAGGMALGFAATENWITLLVDNVLQRRRITPMPINYGLEMRRYYAEVFISRH